VVEKTRNPHRARRGRQRLVHHTVMFGCPIQPKVCMDGLPQGTTRNLGRTQHDTPSSACWSISHSLCGRMEDKQSNNQFVDNSGRAILF